MDATGNFDYWTEDAEFEVRLMDEAVVREKPSSLVQVQINFLCSPSLLLAHERLLPPQKELAAVVAGQELKISNHLDMKPIQLLNYGMARSLLLGVFKTWPLHPDRHNKFAEDLYCMLRGICDGRSPNRNLLRLHVGVAILNSHVLRESSVFDRMVSKLPSSSSSSSSSRKRGGDGDECCPICRDELWVQDELMRMPCSESHVFHHKCIVPWLAKRHNCPNCRFEMTIRLDDQYKSPLIGTPADVGLIK